MDESLRLVYKKKAEKVIDSLKKNNINGYLVEKKEDVSDLVAKIIKKGATVTAGGSISLFESGVIDYLRRGDYNFIDRYQDGLSQDEIKQIYLSAFSADAYFTSTNAITEDGSLYNVDGNGNRVAAMIYGPEKVIVIAGVNKIVKDLDAAIERNKSIAAPPNTIRLGKKTPCARLGYCVDCSSPDRICNKYTLIKKERDKNRMHVILVNESLGY